MELPDHLRVKMGKNMTLCRGNREQFAGAEERINKCVYLRWVNSINTFSINSFWLTAPTLVSLQVHWRWLYPQSLSPHTLATLHCCAVRYQAIQRPSSGGRRTGRTCLRHLTQNLAWQCSHPAPCRSAASNRRTLQRTAVWLTTPAAPERGRTPSYECSQVTDMAAWFIDLLVDWFEMAL